jgi:hypothetical protein
MISKMNQTIRRMKLFKTANYSSAWLTTDGKHSWTFGEIETFVKLPEGQEYQNI